jgi:hypothetical protein
VSVAPFQNSPCQIFCRFAATALLQIILSAVLPRGLFAEVPAPPLAAGAETPAQKTVSAEDKKIPAESDVRPGGAAVHEESHAEPPKKNLQGVFLGYVYSMSKDRSEFIVKAFEPDYPKLRFYIDKKTLFFLGEKPTKVEELHEGDRVAVKFFSLNRTNLADEVTIVLGDFKLAPKYFEVKRKKPKKAGAPPAAAPAKSGH